MTRWEEGLDKRQLASTYRSGDTVAKKVWLFEKLVRNITGWEEGLDKRQLASTYRSRETAAQGILIFVNVKFARSQGGKKD